MNSEAVALDSATFTAWLQAYMGAWEARDGAAAARLFTEDASYHWTPFEPPQRGREEIAAAWTQATGMQREVRTRYEILGLSGRTGIAHWHTALISEVTGGPVRVDGMLLAEFDERGLCRVFREWWHRDVDLPRVARALQPAST